MADLSNITALSGLTITSDQTSGTNDPYATFAVSSVTTTQRDLLENVTPYTVDGTTVKIKEGTIIFNITVGNLQMFRDGAWENITTNITTATGTGLSSAPFSIPSGEKDDVETGDNESNGFLYYDTTNGEVKGYIDDKWMTLFTVSTDATGVGLRDGAPFVLPLATATDEVEVAANESDGFLYYNQLLHRIKGYIHEEWMTIFSINTTATGTGLIKSSPFVVPSGTSASVESGSNDVNGFMYYNTTAHTLRIYKDGVWNTVNLTTD